MLLKFNKLPDCASLMASNHLNCIQQSSSPPKCNINSFVCENSRATSKKKKLAAKNCCDNLVLRLFGACNRRQHTIAELICTTTVSCLLLECQTMGILISAHTKSTPHHRNLHTQAFSSFVDYICVCVSPTFVSWLQPKGKKTAYQMRLFIILVCIFFSV